MPDTLTNSIPVNHLPPCSHRTQRGKRCRLPALDATRGLCFRHAGLHTQEADSGDLSADLLTELDDLQSAQQVNLFLSRLLKILTKNRIATKRAAVLTYICAQILRTMPAIDRELHPNHTEIIFDVPRPSAINTRHTPYNSHRSLTRPRNLPILACLPGFTTLTEDPCTRL